MTEQTMNQLLTDITALMTDLSDRSNARHGEANRSDSGMVAAGLNGQSHAYANAAMELLNLLDKYTD